MTTKYAILSPLTGGYSYADTLDEVADKLAQEAVNLYLNQTHDQPFSIVQTNDDGAETWFSATGEQMPDTKKLIESAALKLKNIQSMRDAAAIDMTTL